MLMVISPAKTLDFESPLATKRYTQPALLDESQKLINVARKLSPADIGSLMHISDKLAVLNAQRFNDWQPARSSSILPSSICACSPAYTACCARST